MTKSWTETQARRLKELDAADTELYRRFETDPEREKAFQKLEKQLVAEHRRRLKDFRKQHLRPALCKLESKLVDVMVKQGFAQVATPILMSRGCWLKCPSMPITP